MRKLLGGAALAAIGAVTTLGVGTAGAAPVVTTAPAARATVSAQDVTWMKANAQTDEAEITISLTAFARAERVATLTTAQTTYRDHVKALAELSALAKADGVTLPSLPNAQQQTQAKTLNRIGRPAFDRRWYVDQIGGHLASIAATRTEIARGSNAAVKAFAKYYLPVAEKHLAMVEADLKALNQGR